MGTAEDMRLLMVYVRMFMVHMSPPTFRMGPDLKHPLAEILYTPLYVAIIKLNSGGHGYH